MRKHIITTSAITMLLASAAHAEPATTSRATDLLAQAFSDAKAVASLPADTKVEVLRRNGAWSEVKTAAGQIGWVRMLTLKFGDAAVTKQDSGGNPLSGLSNLLSTGRTSNTATVTTGVRGLDAEELQNAQANPEELKKLQKFTADKTAAQSFAQRNNLAATKIDYLPETTARGQDQRSREN